MTNRNLPRNAEKPTRDMMDGKKANALMTRYGLAYSSAGAPSVCFFQ